MTQFSRPPHFADLSVTVSAVRYVPLSSVPSELWIPLPRTTPGAEPLELTLTLLTSLFCGSGGDVAAIHSAKP